MSTVKAKEIAGAEASIAAEVKTVVETVASIMAKLTDSWGSLSQQTKKSLYDAASVVDGFSKAVNANCKSDLTEGIAIEDLYLFKTTRITGLDVSGASPVLKKDLGMTDADILKLCSMSMTNLRNFAFAKRSLDIPALTEKANTEWVNNLIEPYVTKSDSVSLKSGKKK